MTAIEHLYQHYKNHRSICTDTRNIIPGCLFFALKGDNFDGNAFAEKALTSGAAFAIIDNLAYKTSDQCILVPDVLSALQDLARLHRQQLSIPVIGLTGSNGKTTTKELINAVLAMKYKTYATKGNLNNHIGVPLSILAISDDTEIAIIEMGANHQKEIEYLCTIAQPTHGLITNVGMAHLDGFGGFEGVKKGKAELYAYLEQHNGIGYINRGNADLLEMSAAFDLSATIYYGTKELNEVPHKHNFILGTLLKSDPYIELEWTIESKTYPAVTNLTGAYNFENILAAICIAASNNVAPDQINAALAAYTPTNNRSQITKTAHNTVICDFYNANPSSMSAALINLAQLTAPKKIAIIGDMFELGAESPAQHQEIAKQAGQLDTDLTLFIGKDFYAFKDQYKGLFFDNPTDALEYLKANPVKDSMILLKGSRGMALEQLLPLL